MFEGNFQQVIGSASLTFLEECIAMLETVASNVQCADVKRVEVPTGSVIILEVQGPRTALNIVVSDVAANGLDLPGFPKLEVAGIE